MGTRTARAQALAGARARAEAGEKATVTMKTASVPPECLSVLRTCTRDMQLVVVSYMNATGNVIDD